MPMCPTELTGFHHPTVYWVNGTTTHALPKPEVLCHCTIFPLLYFPQPATKAYCFCLPVPWCFVWVVLKHSIVPLLQPCNGLHRSRGWVADASQLTGPVGSADPEKATGFILRVSIPLALRMKPNVWSVRPFIPRPLPVLPAHLWTLPTYTLPSSRPEPLQGPGMCHSLLCAQPVHLPLPTHGACVLPSASVISCLFFLFFYSFPLFFFLQGAFPDFQVQVRGPYYVLSYTILFPIPFIFYNYFYSRRFYCTHKYIFHLNIMLNTILEQKFLLCKKI